MPNPNPSPDTRFGAEKANPQSPGGWDKSQSISYQYNRLMRMSPQEFEEFSPETKAQQIAKQRIINAEKDNGLNDAKEITDRTEGKAPLSIDHTTNGESINPFSELTIEELRKLAGK